MILRGEKCYLDALSEEYFQVRSDCDDISDYLDGLNSREIMQYSGISKTVNHTMKTTHEWVTKINSNPNVRLFGIFTDQPYRHAFIGNIRVDIDWVFRVGVVSLAILRKDFHGKGIGTEAIQLISDFAFKDLMLHKLEAGILDGNIASLKAFTKAGYHEEGRKKENRILDGKYVDAILMGKINDK